MTAIPTDNETIRTELRAAFGRIAKFMDMQSTHAADGSPDDLHEGAYAVIATLVGDQPHDVNNYAELTSGYEGRVCLVARSNGNFSWRDDMGRLLALLMRDGQGLLDAADALADLRRLRPIDDWHEDYGDVLWHHLPIQEAPHCGQPGDSEWPENDDADGFLAGRKGYYSHWSPLPLPVEPASSAADLLPPFDLVDTRKKGECPRCHYIEAVEEWPTASVGGDGALLCPSCGKLVLIVEPSGGSYEADGAVLNQDSASQTFDAHTAHAFVVCGGVGSVDTGVVGIQVSGTSITDEAVRTESDTELIVPDITAVIADGYFEGGKKWLGTVTFELVVVSGSPATYSLAVKYGMVTYDTDSKEPPAETALPASYVTAADLDNWEAKAAETWNNATDAERAAAWAAAEAMVSSLFETQLCPRCEGSGVYVGDRGNCSFCHGGGEVPRLDGARWVVQTTLPTMAYIASKGRECWFRTPERSKAMRFGLFADAKSCADQFPESVLICELKGAPGATKPIGLKPDAFQRSDRVTCVVETGKPPASCVVVRRNDDPNNPPEQIRSLNPEVYIVEKIGQPWPIGKQYQVFADQMKLTKTQRPGDETDG